MEADSLPQHLSISIAQHEGQKVTEPHGDMQQARAVASPFTATAAQMETAQERRVISSAPTSSIVHQHSGAQVGTGVSEAKMASDQEERSGWSWLAQCWCPWGSPEPSRKELVTDTLRPACSWGSSTSL